MKKVRPREDCWVCNPDFLDRLRLYGTNDLPPVFICDECRRDGKAGGFDIPRTNARVHSIPYIERVRKLPGPKERMERLRCINRLKGRA